MKLGVHMTAFRCERTIIPAIVQFYGIADKIYVACSSKPWFGDLKADNTFKMAKSTKAVVEEGYWGTEVEQRNWIQSHLFDVDYVLVAYPDTFYTKEDLKRLKKFAESATERQYDVMSKTYWKNYDTIIKPDLLMPATLIKSDVRFADKATIENHIPSAPIIPDVVCHHLSWARTDREIKEKISSYGHANEIIDGWYEYVWKNWRDDMTDFAPTNPTDYKYVEKFSLPDEIRKKLKVSYG